MAGDLLQQLAKHDVPARPAELRRYVHQRLNPRLLIVHLAEFVLRALPYAFCHFFMALTGAVLFTLTGRFHREGEDDAS